MIRLLVVDDHPTMGIRTKLILEKEGFEVDIEVDSGQVIDRVNQHSYDLIILDLKMFGENLELTKQIKTFNKKNRIIIYTDYVIDLYFEMVINAGSCGIISKKFSTEQFITAIRCALHDEVIIPLHLVRQFKRKELVIKHQNKKVTLSLQEQEILLELQKGHSNQDIADNVHMSKRSIEKYLTKIFRKLEVKNRTELLTKAIELGCIPPLFKL